MLIRRTAPPFRTPPGQQKQAKAKLAGDKKEEKVKLDVSSDESTDDEADDADDSGASGAAAAAAAAKPKRTPVPVPVPQDVLDTVTRLKNEGALSCRALLDVFNWGGKGHTDGAAVHSPGNTYFRGEEYADAAEVYTEALDALRGKGSAPTDESRLLGNRAGACRTSCMSLPGDGRSWGQWSARFFSFCSSLLPPCAPQECYLKLGKFQEALEDSQAALACDPSFVKCYHRQSRAQQGLGKVGASPSIARDS